MVPVLASIAHGAVLPNLPVDAAAALGAVLPKALMRALAALDAAAFQAPVRARVAEPAGDLEDAVLALAIVSEERRSIYKIEIARKGKKHWYPHSAQAPRNHQVYVCRFPGSTTTNREIRANPPKQQPRHFLQLSLTSPCSQPAQTLQCRKNFP